MAIAVRNEGGKINSYINVTPMVDVMLVLLIIFMVITPMMPPFSDIKLARANHPLQMPEADQEDALLVAVNKDGKIFFGSDQIPPADLPTKIRERMGTGAGKKVYVKADARVRYKSVVEVVEGVRSAGVSELGLLTERRTP